MIVTYPAGGLFYHSCAARERAEKREHGSKDAGLGGKEDLML